MKRKWVRIEREDGRVVCESCAVADTPLTRLVGLTGRRGLAREDGLLLRPVNAIHTSFMRFAIDAVFVDANFVVVKVVEQLPPWRLSARRGAHAVIELAAGECRRRGVRPGDRLSAVSA